MTIPFTNWYYGAGGILSIVVVGKFFFWRATFALFVVTDVTSERNDKRKGGAGNNALDFPFSRREKCTTFELTETVPNRYRGSDFSGRAVKR